MGEFKLDLFYLLWMISQGYEIRWSDRDGLHLAASNHLLDQWIDEGTIG